MPNIFVTSFLHRQSAASAALYWYSATIRQQLSPYFEGIFLLFCAIKSQEKNFALTVTSTTSQSFPQTVLQQGFEGKTFSTGRNEFRNLKLTDNAFDALGLPAELRGGFVELLVSQSMCMNGLLYVLSRLLLRLQKVAARSSRYQSLPLSILQGGEHRFGFKIGASRPHPPCGVSQLLCRYMLT